MGVLKFIFGNPWLIVMALVAGGAYGAWFYWDYTQDTIADLHTSIAAKDATIAKRDEQLVLKQIELNSMVEQAARQQQELADHDRVIAEIRNRNNQLARELSSINLPQLANEDAKKLETTINKRTQQMLKEFEAISRSE